MEYLFKPRSVAVIGASHNKDKLGYILLENILSGGYRGKVYPVNPRGGEILGLQVYPDIESVDGDVDVAVIAIPAGHVFEAVKGCAGKKVAYCVIISAGFSEVGNSRQEREIVAYAAKNGMRILGPNVLGYYCAESSLNMTFALPRVSPGNIAVISQSGGLGLALVGRTMVENLGLSVFFSVGNKPDIGDAEILGYLADDQHTSVVLIYMEGIKNGERFIKALKKVTRKKPVIIVKAGSSEKGAKAAASHTGALACSGEVFASVMRQCNVLMTESLSEALDWASFFVKAPLPRGYNTLVITNGGGLGVMAVDAMEKRKVPVYDRQDDLKETFEPLISKLGSYGNPVDMTADYSPETFRSVIKAAVDSENIHALFVIHCQVPFCDMEKLSEVIAESFVYAREARKILVFAPFGGRDIDNAVKCLRDRGVPVFDDFLRGVSCIDALFRHARSLSSSAGSHEALLKDAGAKKSISSIVKKAAREGRRFLLAGEIRELLEAAGIDNPEGAVFPDAEAAAMYAEKTGYPLAMKVVSPDVLHKSDAGGVFLNIENSRQVKKSFNLIKENCRRHDPCARFHGVEISRMLEPGLEVIIGARRDASLGPVVMCGMGGIYVEVLKDVSFRSFPLAREEACGMIKELKAYPVMSGIRGKESVDEESVVDAILKAGEILLMCPEIEDLEINPLFVYTEGAAAADARVIIDTGKK